MRDVIIIGAGGGGAVVAKELAERGLDVLVLEAGARHANPEVEWSHFENDQNSSLTGELRYGPSDRTKPAWYREITNNSLVSQVAGVGGTTLHYYGNSPRAMPGIFSGYRGSDASRYDRNFQFPFTYDSFRKYYEWTEATLPVQTAPMGTKEQVFISGCEHLGMAVETTRDITKAAFRPQQNAILQPEGTAGLTTDTTQLMYPQAKGCLMCGYCLQGCTLPRRAPRNLKAKRSTDNSYIPMALTADLWKPGGKAITLVTDAYVTKIRSGRIGFYLTATGVEWKDVNTGAAFSEDAKVIIMAGGCVENPRLWLNSRLPNSNGWVGRGVTDHAIDMVIGQFPFDCGTSKGPGSNVRADFPGFGSMEQVSGGPGVVANALCGGDSGIRGAYTNGVGDTGNWDGPTGRTYGTELKEMLADVNRVMQILILTDDDVESQNRIDVSTVFTDAHGPVPRVNMTKRNRSLRTRANRRFLANKAADILRAAGATKVVRPDFVSVLLHVQSSMRMGSSSSTSVLDSNCEARAVKRLFIADNSALPNSIGGPNPTLTTQALATRTAEKIFEKYFGGRAWVDRETPISSIDDRVTQAVLARGL